ncbi:hypothetical protein FIBSPDRAFT_508263 [Athelia psychrophila]|uniref:Uncharacterized protein n=1 Tax=Athelia psychrophila TaxID=1759441 RepID=A0A166JW05_9AGAM|nr:hypothetical protein FIBSPDRAFT_508263 [Fibularhizoctonia sp. CBS 109695]
MKDEETFDRQLAGAFLKLCFCSTANATPMCIQGGHQEDARQSSRTGVRCSSIFQREQIHPVKDALLHISAPSSVQNLAHTAGRYHIGASQKALIETVSLIHALPMLHFWYDTEVNGAVKIGKQVTFRPELEFRLESWLAPEALG